MVGRVVILPYFGPGFILMSKIYFLSIRALAVLMAGNGVEKLMCTFGSGRIPIQKLPKSNAFQFYAHPALVRRETR